MQKRVHIAAGGDAAATITVILTSSSTLKSDITKANTAGIIINLTRHIK